MKSKILPIIAASLTLFTGIFVFNSMKQEVNRLPDNAQPVINLTGEQISRLEKEVTVRFPATLVKQSGGDCIELFALEDIKEYNGISKHAIFSRFAEPRLAERFEKNKPVIVTGKMTFVKNAAETDKTCGIVTGNIFEITDIE